MSVRSRLRVSPKVAVALVAGPVLAAGAAVGVAVLTSGTPDAHEAQRDAWNARVQARGTTDTVTVPRYAPGAIVPARPRPQALPPVVKADGACGDAMNVLRDFFDATPSGLTLTDTQRGTLNELTGKLRTACPVTLVETFSAQELTPWLYYTPPASGGPTSAAQTPAPAKR